MTTEEHLAKVAAKCRELLAINPGFPRRKYDQSAEAGWRATIASCEDILPYMSETDSLPGASTPGHRFALIQRANNIIAAWPESLL